MTALLAGLGARQAFAVEGSASVNPPALLVRAVEQYLQNQDHWAYTESRDTVGLPERPKGATVLMVDPSKAYAEQIRPLKVDGQPPTAEQTAEYRRKGERIAKRREKERQMEAKSTGATPLQDRIKLYLGDQVAVPDLEHAAVVAEDERSVTYSVPFLDKAGARDPELDSFQVTVRINKLRGDLEHFAVRQQESLRVRLIAKIEGFEEDADFTPVDPRFPSVMTHDVARATISLLFLTRVITSESDRTSLRHVTNYDDLFGVKVGPARILKF